MHLFSFYVELDEVCTLWDCVYICASQCCFWLLCSDRQCHLYPAHLTFCMPSRWLLQAFCLSHNACCEPSGTTLVYILYTSLNRDWHICHSLMTGSNAYDEEVVKRFPKLWKKLAVCGTCKWSCSSITPSLQDLRSIVIGGRRSPRRSRNWKQGI